MHYKDKMVIWPSHPYNEKPYTPSLYIEAGPTDLYGNGTE